MPTGLSRFAERVGGVLAGTGPIDITAIGGGDSDCSAIATIKLPSVPIGWRTGLGLTGTPATRRK